MYNLLRYQHQLQLLYTLRQRHILHLPRDHLLLQIQVLLLLQTILIQELRIRLLKQTREGAHIVVPLLPLELTRRLLSQHVQGVDHSLGEDGVGLGDDEVPD